VVIFDICDTMYDSNTTFDFLDYILKYTLKYNIYRRISKTIIVKVINKILWNTLRIDLIRIVFLRYLKGYSREELLMYIDGFYKDILDLKKRDMIIKILKEEKAKEKDILLMSATIDIVAERIAKEYNVNFISSRLLFDDNNICMGKLEFDLLGIKDKYVNDDIKLVVTDNLSDLQLVKKAKQSIIISKKRI
jgi:phosphoserine phosphatase